MSRQRLWQLKMMQEGRCPQCGKPKGLTLKCDPCNQKWVAKQRLKLGLKPWRPGGRGRPPAGKQQEFKMHKSCLKYGPEYQI